MAGIWANLMLLPFYASYSGSDEFTGFLRASLFLTGVIWQIYVAKISRKIIKPHKPLFFAYLANFVVFFGMVYGFYVLLPPKNEFNLMLFVGAFILFQWLEWSGWAD